MSKLAKGTSFVAEPQVTSLEEKRPTARVKSTHSRTCKDNVVKYIYICSERERLVLIQLSSIYVFAAMPFALPLLLNPAPQKGFDGSVACAVGAKTRKKGERESRQQERERQASGKD